MDELAIRGTPVVSIEPGAPGLRRFGLWRGRFPVEPDQELHYDLRPSATPDDSRFPPDVWWEGPFGATGVAVDAVFDDGSRLSTVVKDQHGVAPDASAQGASLTVRPDQWNRRTCLLSPVAGRTVVGIELVVDLPAGTAAEIAVGAVGIRRTRPSPTVPLDWVDSLRGTNSDVEYSRGNTVPAVALPNGFALTIPVTDPEDGGWPFQYGDPGDDLRFAGLRVGHTPTPWLGDYGTVDVVPRGPDGADVDSAPRESVRVAPHRLQLGLRSGVDVEVVPTHTGSVHRYRFDSPVAPTGGEGVVELRVPGAGALSITPGDDDREHVIIGHSDVSSPLLVGSPRVHLAVRVIGAVQVEPISDGAIRLKADGAAGVVDVEIATSIISAALARSGLCGASFETAAQKARDAWTAVVDLVGIEGATADQRTTFYSSLARIFLYPGVASERDDSGVERFADIATSALTAGRAESAATRILEGRLSVGNGFWDTYRTVWPAYALFAPERAAELLDGFLSHARASGWMPRWAAPGAVDIMVGTSSDIVLADALARGVPLEDPGTALRTALKNATVPSPHPAVGRRGLAPAVFTGYTSSDVDESVAWTIENAINDFGILTMIERLTSAGETTFDGLDLDALQSYFAVRAGAHRALFDAGTGLFRSRDRAGRFEEPFYPSAWGGAYTETDA